jgi:hypothetical protein
MAYDTLSADMINNVLEGLLAFNGSQGGSFVPELSTCIPGAANHAVGGCQTEYGSGTSIPGFTGIFNATGAVFTGSNGVPKYFTYPIDSAAHFYNPATTDHWSVYPTDVMFSVARDLAFAQHPGYYYTSGWILAQALLPFGNPSWDGGKHAGPLNDTPGNILGSMLVNDTHFCPEQHGAGGAFVGNGCITFVANGSAQSWAGFNFFLPDEGASVLPCSWAQSVVAAASNPVTPDFAYTGEASSCLLAGGLNNTDNPTWNATLSTLNTTGATSWDTFEHLGSTGYHHGNPQPPLNTWTVGSGPYELYNANATLATGYHLVRNLYYGQPTGCAGSHYYCYPTAGSYVPDVVNTYVAGTPATDAAAQAAYQSGSVDFAGFTAADTFMLVNGASAGYLKYITFPTLSEFFVDFNLAWNSTEWGLSGLGPAPNVPSNFTASLTVRNFLADSYPYGTVFSTLYKTNGITLQAPACGPLPIGLNNFGNVTCPGALNTGVAQNPINSPTNPQSWAYWWTHGRTPADPHYSWDLAQCTVGHPCTLVLIGENGATDLNTALQDYAAAIQTETGGAIKVSFISVSFDTLISLPVGLQDPALIGNLGWAPDYALPADYLAPIEYDNGYFTGEDNVAYGLSNASFNNVGTCGHNANTVANVVYWAKNPSLITDSCQGIAYFVAVNESKYADTLPYGDPVEQTIYWAVDVIYNTLSLYIWQGQANQIVAMAPWINASTVNSNPLVGGGGDQYWFNIGYQATTSVTFQETGLPVGAEWTVNGPSNAVTVLGPSTGTSMTLQLPRGKAAFIPSMVAQAPGTWYEYKSASASSPLTVGTASPPPVALTFAAAGNATFAETGLAITSFAAPVWCLSLTSTLAGKGPAPYSNCTAAPASPTTPSYINTTGIAPGSWSYKITVPTGYIICAAAGVPPTRCTAPGANWTKVAAGVITIGSGPGGVHTANLVFLPQYVTITFQMVGLGKGLIWFANVSNYTATASPIFISASQFTPLAGLNRLTVVLLKNASAVYEFQIDTQPTLSNYVPSIMVGFLQPSVSKTIVITAFDPHHAHVILYAPSAARRAEAL